MTAAATSMPLLFQARTAAPTEATAGQPAAPADAEARTLAAAVGRGEEAAFGELYQRYQRRLLRLALVLARGDELLAQDAVQAAFLTAANKLRATESEAHLWNWLARVVRQQTAKRWRQQQRDSLVIGMAELPEFADDRQADTVMEQTLDAALQAMETEERELLERFYFDRSSHKEIAERLGTTAKSVSSRLERARAKLRASLTRKLSHEI